MTTTKKQPSLEGLQRQVFELQIEQIRKDIDDHEKRIRIVEDAAIRFNFLLYLTMGGGLISIFNLLAIVFLVVQVTSGDVAQ